MKKSSLIKDNANNSFASNKIHSIDMQGAILDSASFDRGDINLNPLTHHTVKWTSYKHTTEQQTIKRVSNQNIIITNKVKISRDLILATPALKLILVAATGVDHVDINACKQRNISVCNVSHYATAAVTQHALTMLLNLFTHQIEYQLDVKQGKWSQSEIFCLLDHTITEAENRTLGIIGYGVLGKKMATLATALGMNVIISERPGSTGKQRGRLAFTEILKQSDVISLHCPLTQHTKHLFGATEFAQMKSTAIIINTARGAIIDSYALANALKKGIIAGAGIDVLDQEPPTSDHPLLQPNIPNILITPHNAWGSRESRQRLVDVLAKNLQAWLNHTPINIVA